MRLQHHSGLVWGLLAILIILAVAVLLASKNTTESVLEVIWQGQSERADDLLYERLLIVAGSTNKYRITCSEIGKNGRSILSLMAEDSRINMYVRDEKIIGNDWHRDFRKLLLRLAKRLKRADGHEGECGEAGWSKVVVQVRVGRSEMSLVFWGDVGYATVEDCHKIVVRAVTNTGLGPRVTTWGSERQP